MTPEDREKLIEAMADEYCDATSHRNMNVMNAMRAVLNLAEDAFDKEIEAAYMEGFSNANARITRHIAMNGGDSDWYDSRAYAAFVARTLKKTS